MSAPLEFDAYFKERHGIDLPDLRRFLEREDIPEPDRDYANGELAFAELQFYAAGVEDAELRVFDIANFQQTFERLVPLAKKGQKFTQPERGVGPLRKAIRRALAKHPKATNAEIWATLQKKPPKGFEFHSVYSAAYPSISTPSKPVDKKTFSNACAQERQLIA